MPPAGCKMDSAGVNTSTQRRDIHNEERAKSLSSVATMSTAPVRARWASWLSASYGATTNAKPSAARPSITSRAMAGVTSMALWKALSAAALSPRASAAWPSAWRAARRSRRSDSSAALAGRRSPSNTSSGSTPKWRSMRICTAKRRAVSKNARAAGGLPRSTRPRWRRFDARSARTRLAAPRTHPLEAVLHVRRAAAARQPRSSTLARGKRR